MKLLSKLKSKWNIQSNWDFIVIMLIFSLAGMSIVYIRKPLFHLIGITANTPFWFKAIIYIPLVVPIYQLNLLFWGFLLGQFSFFWEKEKKLVGALAKLFKGKRSSGVSPA